jgi:hypothetical protein
MPHSGRIARLGKRAVGGMQLIGKRSGLGTGPIGFPNARLKALREKRNP